MVAKDGKRRTGTMNVPYCLLSREGMEGISVVIRGSGVRRCEIAA